MATKAQLTKTAKELNELFGLEPEIDVKGKPADMLKGIQEAILMYEEEDELSEATITCLGDIDWDKHLETLKEEDQERLTGILKGLNIWLNPEEEETEEEETKEEPKEEKAAKKEAKPKKDSKKETKKGKDSKKGKSEDKPKKEKTKRPGVIATIVELIEGAGKKGITKEEILEGLKEAFPDRATGPMKNTVSVQVPGRISREKFELEKLEGGKYRKK